ncbi:thioredoxin family protein [Streptomyces sp. NPDC093808]|uniref:thioredoxin family protein n=1 Tax=Streptomyces sp. NPDC093808 TaxID=3154985 RepID=UPI00344D45CA
MRITVLTVPDCPNAPVVRERITTALDGRAVQVELVEVTEDAEAARWGMTGSPTVLLDGVDPFAAAGAVPSVSCRLYRDEDGRIEGAPSVTALRDALAGADAGMECCARAAPPSQSTEEQPSRRGTCPCAKRPCGRW